MDRAQKEKVVEELGQVFQSSGVVVVARYTGLTVAEMQDFRARMRGAGGHVRVAKNRLAKIAIEGTACESIRDLFEGMTLLAYCEDPVSGAKAVRGFAEDNEKLVILGGSMAGSRLDEAGVRAVADMMSREELLSWISGCLAAPGANVAAALEAPARSIASLVEAVEERAEA